MQRTLPGPSEILDRSWRDFSEHLGPMVGAVLIGFGLLVALYFVVGIAMFGLMYLFRGNQMVFQLVNNAVTGVFTVAFLGFYIGYARFNLEIMRGAEPNLMTLFNQWRLVPNYFLTNALVTMISFLTFIPFVALAAGPIAALWDQSNPWPALGVGVVTFAVMTVVLVPLSAGLITAALFTIDRELDPIASVVAGLRTVRGNVGWIYMTFFLLVGAYFATTVLLCTGIGALVAIPFMTLMVLHCYEGLAQTVEAELAGQAAEVAPETVGEEPSALQPAEEGPAEEAPEKTSNDNPYAPPSAKVDGPTQASARQVVGRPAPQLLPADARRYRPEAPAKVTKIAIVCLIPWILAGGNPFSGAVIGFMLGRMLGFPSWAGAIAGFGGLTLCGLAAIVVLFLGHRGKRDVIVDEAGLALDGNAFWTGVRLHWHELRGFRISPRGVELYLQGAWGWIWRPIVPTRERDTHDLVEKLEGQGILRIAE